MQIVIPLRPSGDDDLGVESEYGANCSDLPQRGVGGSALDPADPPLRNGRRAFHLSLSDALRLSLGGQGFPETPAI